MLQTFAARLEGNHSQLNGTFKVAAAHVPGKRDYWRENAQRRSAAPQATRDFGAKAYTI